METAGLGHGPVDAGGAALAGLQSCWLDRAGRGGAPAGQRVVTDLDRLLIERAGR